MRKNYKKTKAEPVKEEGVVIDGVILENLSNGRFSVKLDDIDSDVIAHICGKMRSRYIRLLSGDRVKVELSPYDMTKGRIIFRYR